MPPHVASCLECQERVARLRRRGSSTAAPCPATWTGLPSRSGRFRPSARWRDPLGRRRASRLAIRRPFAKHRFLAFGSLAAALVLVATATISRRVHPVLQRATVAPTPSPVDRSDELLRRSTASSTTRRSLASPRGNALRMRVLVAAALAAARGDRRRPDAGDAPGSGGSGRASSGPQARRTSRTVSRRSSPGTGARSWT